MEIAVTGEGATDYGKRINGEWQWGAVGGYVSQLLDEIAETPSNYALVPIERAEIKKLKMSRTARNARQVRGHCLPASKFYAIAKERGFEMGIFYCDADKDARAKNTEKAAADRFHSIHTEVTQGLGEGFIPMVALRMIECWLSGDIGAIENTLGVKINRKNVVGRVETLWGKKEDAESNFPKNYLERLIRLSDKKYRGFSLNYEIARQIAENALVSRMLKACPISYAQFYDDFKRLLDEYQNCLEPEIAEK